MALTPVPFPSGIHARNITVRWVANSVVTRSPLSGSTQISRRLGGIWALTLEITPLSRFDAARLQGVLFGVDGVALPIRLGPLHPKPVDFYDASAPISKTESWTVDLDFTQALLAVRYITTPAMLVDGNQAAGSPTLDVKGMAGIGLNAGDWFSVVCAGGPGGQCVLHQVREDVFPDSSGEAEFKIHPPLRKPADNDSELVIENPKGSFVFAGVEDAAFTTDERGVTTPQTLPFLEFIRT